MNNVVIVDCVRTPIGRSHADTGYYRHTRGDDLAVACLQALLQRNPLLDPAAIDDVLLGCALQQGGQGHNAARLIALMAGIPATSGGCTINRLCGSSLQALNQAAHAIECGMSEVAIVGGFEHMQHVPIDLNADLNPKLFAVTSKGAAHMGITAEFLAQSQNISRADQDGFALRSHQRAAAAHAAGEFDREVIPTLIHNAEGGRERTTFDQCIRRDTTAEALAALPPAFMPKIGTVTAGNSSPLNDGAAALLVMSEAAAHRHQLKGLAKVRATAVAGVDACVMGTGPVPAVKKLLSPAKISLGDIGLVELNEAFAAQALTCLRKLKLNEEKVNVRGGAIAIGHPLGASGARIATTLLSAMRDRQQRFGIATMCIGFGQGIATLLELVE